MIEMGMLFKNLIPIETLGGMPLPFLHRLRDIRIKQLEDQNKQRMATANNGVPAIPQSAIDDIVDEIS